jgi:hypothetical protein
MTIINFPLPPIPNIVSLPDLSDNQFMETETHKDNPQIISDNEAPFFDDSIITPELRHMATVEGKRELMQKKKN